MKSIADQFRHALRAGFTIEEIFNLTKIDRWILVQIKESVDFEEMTAMDGVHRQAFRRMDAGKIHANPRRRQAPILASGQRDELQGSEEDRSQGGLELILGLKGVTADLLWPTDGAVLVHAG